MRRGVNVRLLLGILVATAALLRIAQRLLARRRAREAARAAPGFRCPSCGTARLVVTSAIALPGDADTNAIDLEALACRRCSFRGAGVRSERPASHLGYPMSPVAWGRLSSAVERCPAPSDRACSCPAHARFGAQRTGSWVGLGEVDHDAAGRFVIM